MATATEPTWLGSWAVVENLTPSIIKELLLISAIKLDQPHMLEQGNGLLNIKTAVELGEEYDPELGEIVLSPDPAYLLGKEVIWAGGVFASGRNFFESTLADVSGPEASFSWGDGVQWTASRDIAMVQEYKNWAVDVPGSAESTGPNRGSSLRPRWWNRKASFGLIPLSGPTQ